MDKPGVACDNCGITSNFCGYHFLGPRKISLCLTCGDQDVEVIGITIPGEAGFFEKSLDSALEALRGLVDDMNFEDEPYFKCSSYRPSSTSFAKNNFK